MPELNLSNFDIVPMSGNLSEINWKSPSNYGLCFARLTGDYNPSHYLSTFARINGFNKNFCHGLLAIASNLQQLPDLELNRPVRVDSLLKGPVYYSSRILTRYFCNDSGLRYDLFCGSNKRPSICGNIQNVRNGSVIDLSPGV